MTYEPSVPFADPSFSDPLQGMPATGTSGMPFLAPEVAPEALLSSPVGNSAITPLEAPMEPIADQESPAYFAERLLTSEQWVKADAKTRGSLVERAVVAALTKMEGSKDVSLGGRKLFEEDGTYNDVGLAAMDRMKAYFTAAAKLPEGGTRLNKVTGKYEALHGLEQIFNQPAEAKVPSAFDEVDDYKASLAAGIQDEGQPAKPSWDSYVEFVNSRLPGDSPSRLDPNNKDLRKKFEQGIELEAFDAKSMAPNSPATIVGGKVVFNPELLGRPDLIGPWVDSLGKDWSAMERKKILVDFDRARRGVQVEAPDDGKTDFGRGWRVAWRQMPELFYGTIGLLGETMNKATGGAVGTGMRDWGLEGVKDAEAGMMPLHKPHDDLDHVWNDMKKGDVGSIIDYLQYGLGYVVGQGVETIGMSWLGSMAGALAGGSAGAVVAAPTAELAAPVTIPVGAGVGASTGAIAPLVARKATEGFIRNQIRKLGVRQALKIVTKESKDLAANRMVKYTEQEIFEKALSASYQKAGLQRVGQLMAVGSNAMMMELGSIYPEAVKQAEKEGREFGGSDLARVWGWGMLSGLTEFAGDMFGLDMVTGRFNKNLEKLVGVSGQGGSDVAKRLGKIALGTLGDMAVESGQEGIQTFLERLGAHQDVSSDEAWSDYRNSMALGALGGAVMGGVGGGMSASRAPNDARSRFQALAQSIVGAPEPRNIKDTLTDAAATTPEATPIELEEGLPNPTAEQLADLDTKAERALPEDLANATVVSQDDPAIQAKVGEVHLMEGHAGYLVKLPGESEIRKMPAVSNVIKEDPFLGANMKDFGDDTTASDKGNAIHVSAATAWRGLNATGNLPMNTSTEIGILVRAIKSKIGTIVGKVLTEQPLVHKPAGGIPNGYAGTADTIFRVKRGGKQVSVMVDIKSTSQNPYESESKSLTQYAVQQALYNEAWQQTGEAPIDENYLVFVKPDGQLWNTAEPLFRIMGTPESKAAVGKHVQRIITGVGRPKKATVGVSTPASGTESQPASPSAFTAEGEGKEGAPAEKPAASTEKPEGLFAKGFQVKHSSGKTGTVIRVAKGKGKQVTMETAEGETIKDDPDKFEAHVVSTETAPKAEQTPEPSQPEASTASIKSSTSNAQTSTTNASLSWDEVPTMDPNEVFTRKDRERLQELLDKADVDSGSTRTFTKSEREEFAKLSSKLASAWAKARESGLLKPFSSPLLGALSRDKHPGNATPKSVSRAKEPSPAATPVAEHEVTEDERDNFTWQEQDRYNRASKGWDDRWPMVPADVGNATFREGILNDKKLSEEEKQRILAFNSSNAKARFKVMRDANGAFYPQIDLAGTPQSETKPPTTNGENKSKADAQAEEQGQVPQVTPEGSPDAQSPAAQVRAKVPEHLRGMVTVIGKDDSLPKPVADFLAARGLTRDNMGAVYFDGKVWINSEQVSPDEVAGKIAHEVFIHAGLRTALGEDGVRKLSREIWNTLTKEERASIAKEWKTEDIAEIGEEWLANEAERVVREGVTNTVWTKIANEIRKALRAMGVTVRFSDTEIAGIVAKGEKAVTGTSSPAVQIDDTLEGAVVTAVEGLLPEKDDIRFSIASNSQKRSKTERRAEAAAILDDEKPGSLSRAVAWASDEKNVPDSDERAALVQELRDNAADDEITTETHPVKPIPENVLRPVIDGSLFADEGDMTSGEKDSAGGKWDVRSTNATYTTAKGKVLAIGTTSLVQVKKADGSTDVSKVMVLKSAMQEKDGTTVYQFTVVDLNNFADASTNEIRTLLGKSNRWHANSLLRVARKIQPLIKARMKGQKLTPAEMKGIFEEMLAQVAPGMSVANFVEAELTGEDFISTTFPVVDDKIVPQIEVNWQRMSDQMARDFGGMGAAMTQFDAGDVKRNYFYEIMMGMEFARVISKFISEETLHLSAADFTLDELMSFHKDAEALAKESPAFRELYGQTVDERFEANGWVEKNPDGSIKTVEWAAMETEPKAVAAVVHEVLRKLHQLAFEGETTEQARSEAQNMAVSILADAEAERSGSGMMKAGRVIARLLKRYAERLKRVLTIHAINGKMTPHMREMMERLKRNQRERGIRSDTDYAKAGVVEWFADIRDIHKEASNERIRETTKQVTAGLQALRLANNEWKDLGIEDLLEVDLQAMKVLLAPEVKEALAKLRNLDGGLKYDLPAIEAAIEELNRINVAVEVREQIWNSDDALVAARENLPMNLEELFTNTNPLRWSDHQMKVNAMILDGIKQNPSRGHLLLAHIQNILAHAYTRRDRLRAFGDSMVLDALKQADWNQPEGQAMIGRIAAAIGLVDHRIGNYADEVVPEHEFYVDQPNIVGSIPFRRLVKVPEYTIPAIETWRDVVIEHAKALAYDKSGSLLEPQRKNGFFDEVSKLQEQDRVIENLEAQRKLFMDLQEDRGDAAHHHAVLERYARLEAANRLYEINNPRITAGAVEGTTRPDIGTSVRVDENGVPFADKVDENGFRTTVEEQVKAIEEERAKARLALLAIDTEARRAENSFAINEVYQAYEAYVDALFNANAARQHAGRVAMGDGYLNTKGFGQEFANLSDERLRKFLSQKDDLALAEFEAVAPSARRSWLAQKYGLQAVLREGDTYGPKNEGPFKVDAQGHLPDIDYSEPENIQTAMPFGFRHNFIGLSDTLDATNNRPAHFEPFAKGTLHNAVSNVQDSNAAYVGMRAFHQFSHMMADGLLLTDRESKAYSANGGFASDAKYNPETGRWEFPSYFEVLPVMDARSGLADLKERLGGYFDDVDGKKVHEREQRRTFMRRFGDPAKHRKDLDSLEKWIQTVQRSLSDEYTEVDQDSTSMDVAPHKQGIKRRLRGKQTIAGRVEGVLRQQLLELQTALDDHSVKFDAFVKYFNLSHAHSAESALKKYYMTEVNNGSMIGYDDYRKSLYVKEHGSDEGYVPFNVPEVELLSMNQIKSLFDKRAGSLNNLVDGMWAADLTVKLTRHALRRFSDPDIRRETYRDLNRVLQDAGYESSNPEFMSARDSNIDPATLSTLMFAMDYYGTTANPSFGIGPSLALDLLAARNGDWNNDENELISPTVARYKSHYELTPGTKPLLRWQPFDVEGNPSKTVQEISSEWIDAQVDPETKKVTLTNYAQIFAGKPGQWVKVLDGEGNPVMIPTVHQTPFVPHKIDSEGNPVVDENGNPVLDEKGNPKEGRMPSKWSGQVIIANNYAYARKDIDQGAQFPREAGQESNAKDDVRAKKAKKNLKNMDADRQMRKRQITREALIIGYVGKDAHAAQRFLYDIDALDRNYKKAFDGGIRVMDLVRRGLRGMWNIEGDGGAMLESLMEEFVEANPTYRNDFNSINPTEAASDKVTPRPIQIGTKRFNAESFLTDLLQFKAVKEEAEIVRMQNLHEPVMRQLEDALGGAVSAKQSGKKQTREIFELFQRQRTGTRSMPVCAANSLSGNVFRSEQDNAAAWVLLRALPGAIVWAPSQRDLLGTEIKAKFAFIPARPARDGKPATPPVIFAPQGSVMGLDDSRFMIAKGLLEHAKRSAWSARQLGRFADRGREMFSYGEIINRAETSIRSQVIEELARRPEFKAMRKAAGFAAFKSQLKGINKPTQADTFKAGNTAANVKKVFDVALRRWFDQMALVAEALEDARQASSKTASRVVLEEGKRSRGVTNPFERVAGLDSAARDDVDLTVFNANDKRDMVADAAFVAEVLANPKMRQLYEMMTMGEAQDLGWAPPRDRSEIIDAILQAEKPVEAGGFFGPDAFETRDLTEVSDDMPATGSPWDPASSKILDALRESLMTEKEREDQTALEASGILELLDEVSNTTGVADLTRAMNRMLPDRGVGEGYRSGSMTKAQANIYNLLAGLLRQAKNTPSPYGMRTATRMVEKPYQYIVSPESPWDEPTIVTRSRMEEETYDVPASPIEPRYMSSPNQPENPRFERDRDRDLRFFSRGDALRLWRASSNQSPDLAPVLDKRGNDERVTDWASLAKVGGSGHMVLPPAFYKRRLNAFKTGMVGQIHGINTENALNDLRGKLVTKSAGDPQELFNAVLRDSKWAYNTDIPLDGPFMDRLASILPPGLWDQHLADAQGMIGGMRARHAELAGATQRLNGNYANLLENWMALRDGTAVVNYSDEQIRAANEETAERFAAAIADAAPGLRKLKNQAAMVPVVKVVTSMLKSGALHKQVSDIRKYVEQRDLIEKNNPEKRGQSRDALVSLARRFFESRNAKMLKAFEVVLGQTFPPGTVLIETPHKLWKMGGAAILGQIERQLNVDDVAKSVTGRFDSIARRGSARKLASAVKVVFDTITHTDGSKRFQGDTDVQGGPLARTMVANLIEDSRTMTRDELAYKVRRLFGLSATDIEGQSLDPLATSTIADLLNAFIPSSMDVMSLEEQRIQNKMNEIDRLLRQQAAESGRLARELARIDRGGKDLDGEMTFDVPVTFRRNPNDQRGMTLRMGLELLPADKTEEARLRFAERRLAFERAMQDYFDHGADDTFDMMKGDHEMFLDYDVERLMEKVVTNLAVQNAVTNRRWKDFETNGGEVLAIERLAEVVEPDGINDLLVIEPNVTEALREEVTLLEKEYEDQKNKVHGLTNMRVERLMAKQSQMFGMKAQLKFAEDALQDVEDKLAAAKIRMDVATSQERRVTRIKRTGGYEARVERIGRFLKDREGADVMLMPVSAREDLRAHFKVTGDKRAVDPTLAGLVLNALVAPAVARPSSYAVYDLGYSVADLNREFTGYAGHSLLQKEMTANPTGTITLKRAADIYAKRLTELVTVAVNSKLLDTSTNTAFTGNALADGKMTKRRIDYWEGLMRQMVYAHNDLQRGVDDRKAFEQLNALLRHLDAGNFGGDPAMPMADIRNLKLVPVYAKVFAEIEGRRTMDRLVTGLTGDLTETELKLLANFHHQDARIKRRFQRDWSSYMEALRMQGYLENGFSTAAGDSTGRNGYHAAYEEGKKTMLETARKLGTESMDHSLGYVIGSLGGITHARGGHVGENLMKWMKAFREGATDLQRYVKDQEEAFAKSKLGVKKFFNAAHVDMTRDLPMVKAIGAVMERTVGKWFDDTQGVITSTPPLAGNVTHRQAMDAEANAAITAAVQGLHALASNQPGVDTYAKTLLGMFRDLADAVAFDKAVLGQDDATDPAEGRYNLGMDPHASMYTVMPLRFVFAGSQKENKTRMPHMDTEHRTGDPMRNISLKGASILAKGESNPDDRKANVFHMMELNGLSAPEAILRDTVYRLNVGPNYQILRALTGKRKEVKGQGSSIVNPLDSELMKIRDTEQGVLPEDRNWKNDERRWKMTLAAVAGEIEGNINNDASMGMHNTAFSKALQFMSTMFVFGALFSIQQLPLQTIPSVIGYITKKLVVGKHGEALMFLKNLAPLVGGAVLGKKFAGLAGSSDFIGFSREVNDFIKGTSPWVHARGSEGMDESRNLKRRQVPFGAGAFKKKAIRGGNELIAAQEAGLDFVIARWERPIARAIYMTELVAEMQRMKADPTNGLEDAPVDARDLIARKDTLKIPQSAIIYATIKVSDHMGLADQAKKANPFQSHTQSPTWHHLFRTMVRFSNHTATTSSNLSAQLPAAFLDPKDPDTARIRSEAIENITGTLVQNTLFQFARVAVTVPLLYMLVGLLKGKDWDEAARDAQDASNELLKAGEDAGETERIVKQVLFGTARGPFSEYKEDREARYSGAAEISSKALLELAQAIPYAGVFAGYSAVSNLAKPTVNKITEEAMSFVSGGFGFGDDRITRGPDGISIPTYKDTGVGELSGLTAPTSMLYDTLVAGNRLYNAGTMTDATAYDMMKYVVAQLIGTRELRTAMDKEFTEEIR